MPREAFCTTGYSPFLFFTVPDLQGSITRLLNLGATMDGRIQYAASGKVCAYVICEFVVNSTINEGFTL